MCMRESFDKCTGEEFAPVNSGIICTEGEVCPGVETNGCLKSFYTCDVSYAMEEELGGCDCTEVAVPGCGNGLCE
ncbi:MAG: hypothetical protein H6765_00240 [Candidatus Peribacteria bacterium]|nr:MAG: hypothetical protein H6765_00240 [Candidatus Peribacteria bacterium]